MRKMTVVVLMVALLLTVAPSTFAKSTIVGNPLGLLVASLSAEYETEMPALGDEMTIAVPFSYWGVGGISVLGVGAGARYYIDGRAHEGIYVGGYAHMLRFGFLGYSATAFSISGVGGYKMIFDNNLVADAGVSLGFGFGDSGETTLWGPAAWAVGGAMGGFGLKAGVGYAF